MKTINVLSATGRRILPRHLYVACKPIVERWLGVDEREVAVVRDFQFLKTRRAIDVGANWGGYTVMLAKRFDRVEAIEPVASCAAALRAYASAFVGNLTVREVLSSDRPGFIDFLATHPDDEGGDFTAYSHVAAEGETGGLPMRAEPIDSYGFDDVDFIKIDVEGHERNVIAGAVATIRQSRPVLLVEIERRHTIEPFEERIAFVRSLGYETVFYRDGRLEDYARFDLARDQEPSLIKTDRRRYINNFFFLPKESAYRFATP